MKSSRITVFRVTAWELQSGYILELIAGLIKLKQKPVSMLTLNHPIKVELPHSYLILVAKRRMFWKYLRNSKLGWFVPVDIYSLVYIYLFSLTLYFIAKQVLNSPSHVEFLLEQIIILMLMSGGWPTTVIYKTFIQTKELRKEKLGKCFFLLI